MAGNGKKCHRRNCAECSCAKTERELPSYDRVFTVFFSRPSRISWLEYSFSAFGQFMNREKDENRENGSGLNVSQ